MSLKKKLKEKYLSLGSWITLAHPAIAEIMVRSGFDWLAVDLEHSTITIREAEDLIRVIGMGGKAPLVRLTSNDVDLIKRVMDAGSHGVIVPMVNTLEDAQKAIASVYYPTEGRRGVGLARAQGYGASFDDYRHWLRNEAVVIVQIEHIEAVKNIREILSVEEVDGYIIGPYDLSASMGIPGQLEHPRVIESIRIIQDTAAEMKKPGGIHIIEPNPLQLKQRLAEGFTFIAYSLDVRMIDRVCREGLAVIQGVL